MGDPSRLEGMARFGIQTRHAVGISLPDLRAFAKRLGRDHDLAAALWRSRIHEARILASIVDDPDAVTDAQMESWIRDVDSWDLCDQLCANLFVRTSRWSRKAIAWSRREEEFVRRAGFALMAAAAVDRKDADDATFEAFLPRIASAATDDRNFVRKAVSWALRQIGKRDIDLNRRAIAVAREIGRTDARSARWIARDVLRELESEPVLRRLASG